MMVHWLDLFGTAVFAITGALAAGRKDMDVFGALMLAFVTAVGGGTIRDMILDIRPVFWIADLNYLSIVVGSTLLAFGLVRWMKLIPRKLLVLCDAIGLAVFAVIGCQKSMSAHVHPAIAVMMGMVTGVMGGVLRDVLSGEIPLVFRSQIYATASIVGGAIYVLLHLTQTPQKITVLAAMAATLLLRLPGVYWNLSLPRFHPERD